MYLAVAAGTDAGSRLIAVEGVEGGRFSMWAGVKPGLVAVSVEDNEARRPQSQTHEGSPTYTTPRN